MKFRGKIPVNIEYENTKQKMDTLITERTDIKPLLGTACMKRFKLTICKIQLTANNQSEKYNNKTNKKLVCEQPNYKRHQNKYTAKTGTLPGKTKNQT